jgi:AGCS family alanine or glycine:cation symporter
LFIKIYYLFLFRKTNIHIFFIFALFNAMDTLNEFLTKVSGIMWGYPMILLLIGTHILLTIRLRLPQRHLFKAIRLSLSKDKESTGEVSQFGALATALAATIGTGNIVGVGTAIALGGPGAVFWCWITGVLGIATKYGENQFWMDDVRVYKIW